MNDFFDAVRRFLLDYLPKQRCLSENTILSYRQTLNIFVAYMRDEMGIGATELTFSRIDRDVILGSLPPVKAGKRAGMQCLYSQPAFDGIAVFSGFCWTN